MDYNRIKKVLESTGKSQKWLSEELGTTTVTVNHWCNQKSQPPIKTLFEISKVLETTPDQLLNSCVDI